MGAVGLGHRMWWLVEGKRMEKGGKKGEIKEKKKKREREEREKRKENRRKEKEKEISEGVFGFRV